MMSRHCVVLHPDRSLSDRLVVLSSEGRPYGRPGLLYLLEVNDLFENILILNKLY